jgi:hypothetical protein
LVDSPSELPDGIHSDEVGCSVGAGSAGIGSGSIAGIIGAGAGSGADTGFFLGAAFFFAIRLAFFFAPFLALRFLGKQLHRPIVEGRQVIKASRNFLGMNTNSRQRI